MTATNPPAPTFGCTCHRLRRLSRLMTLRYDQALAPAGMTVNQFSILRRAQEGRHSVAALAATLGMERSTLSRDLKRLVAAGWVILRPNPEDARQRQVALTAAGGAAIAGAEPRWKAAQARLEAGAGVDEIGRLHAILDRVARTLDR